MAAPALRVLNGQLDETTWPPSEARLPGGPGLVWSAVAGADNVRAALLMPAKKSSRNKPGPRRGDDRPQGARLSPPEEPTAATKAREGASSARSTGGTSALAWLRERLSGPPVAALVVVCALTVYLLTLAPTVTTEDSGELLTAAARWGVAHPPGYPLFCLVLQPFVRAPFWSPAFGGNLASAVLGALAAGGVALVALQVGVRPRFAAAGGLLFAFARDVWAQSVITEVYTLHVLLLVSALLFAFRFEEGRRPRDVHRAAGLFGLALANHYPLTLLAAPALLALVVGRPRGLLGRARDNARSVALALGLAAAGLAVYAYLPLAASGEPPLNWGDPSSWERLWAHVSRAAYRKLEVGRISGAEDKVRFLGLFFELLAAQWTAPALIVLGALGVHQLRRRPRELATLLAIAGLSGVGLTLILNYDYDFENVQRMDELYLPVYAALAPVLAAGLARASEEIGRRVPAAARAAGAALPAAFLLPLGLHYRHNDLSNDRLAREHNAFVLESLPPDAVYFTSGDYTSFPSLYLQAVEGKRPDAILADFTGELSPAARAYLAELDPSVDPSDRSAVQAAFLERGHRPVLIAAKSDLKVPAPVEPWGLVYLVRGNGSGRKGAERPPDLLGARIALPDPIPGADGLLRSLLADRHLMRGEALFVSGDRDGAREAFKRAVATQPSSKQAVNNVASTAAERGFLADAERWFLQAAALSPTYVTPRRNLARLLDSAGRREEAVAAYRELIRVAPDDQGAKTRLEELLHPSRKAPAPDRPVDRRVEDLLAAIAREPAKPSLYNNLGNVHAEQGDARRAKESYEKALQLDPEYALAYKNLAVLHRDILKDPAAAEQYFEKYRSLGGE